MWNLYDKDKYCVNIKILKETQNHGLIFKKVHCIVKFNQEAWLEAYIDIILKLRWLSK